MKRRDCDRVELAWIDRAPVRLVNSVEIAATPDRIWAALEDASAWPRWASVITGVQWTSAPPFGVGTTRTVTMRGRMTAFERFIAWEPHRVMAFRFDAATMDGVSAFAERYDIEPVDDGRTRVTWVMAMAPKGVSKVIVPATRVPMQRLFGRFLRTFARLVEAEYARTPA